MGNLPSPKDIVESIPPDRSYDVDVVVALASNLLKLLRNYTGSEYSSWVHVPYMYIHTSGHKLVSEPPMHTRVCH